MPYLRMETSNSQTLCCFDNELNDKVQKPNSPDLLKNLVKKRHLYKPVSEHEAVVSFTVVATG